jgi:NF-X1-type zinc finger protein NFXL1
MDRFRAPGGRGRGRGAGAASSTGAVSAALASVLGPGQAAGASAARPPSPEPAPALDSVRAVTSRMHPLGPPNHKQCMLCETGTVDRRDEVWQCECCFSLFHLVCVQRWIATSASQFRTAGLAPGSFACPLCCSVFTSSEYPERYTCFCGRVTNPPDDEWIDPHCCGEVCGRPLAGCSHQCTSLCHPGPCPVCPRPVCAALRATQKHRLSEPPPPPTESLSASEPPPLSSLKPASEDSDSEDEPVVESVGPKVLCKCVCGRTEQLRPPGRMSFKCRHRCQRLCKCGRHLCGRRCCPGGNNCRECSEVCGRLLACGVHRCQARCHPGRCPKCPVKSTVSCACGATSVTVRCGEAAEPPVCERPCRKPLDCGHTPPPHTCHTGDCPACTHPCGKTYTRCGHSCDLACHFPSPCPPCAVVLSVVCVGGHETRDQRCSAPAMWQCERRCGRSLPCGKHMCERRCHDVALECGECPLPCREPRACLHPCVVSDGGCHPGDCSPCASKSRVSCHCGRDSVELSCHKVSEALGLVSQLPLLRTVNDQEALRALIDAPKASSPLGVFEAEHKAWRDSLRLPDASSVPVLTTVLGWSECPPTSSALDGSALDSMLSCGSVCPRLLPCCSHSCSATCHAGGCPAAEPFKCARQVKVRCKCGKRTESVPCGVAQRMRQARGLVDTSRLDLLDCDDRTCAVTTVPSEAAVASSSVAVLSSASSDVALPSEPVPPPSRVVSRRRPAKASSVVPAPPIPSEPPSHGWLSWVSVSIIVVVMLLVLGIAFVIYRRSQRGH